METVAMNDLPSSVHAVESNDDLLIEIFLRLPDTSLFVFKSVSKRWLSLITKPYITPRRSQIPNLELPSGLIIESSFTYDLVSLKTNKSPSHTPFKFSFDDSGAVKIMQSCNGLLLCCIWRYEYYVYNPSMNRFRKLPRINHESNFHVIGMRIAFDPTKSPHYKVVCVGYTLEKGGFQIKTYSSETCYKWSSYGGEYYRIGLIFFEHGIYSNDAIHWLDTSDNLVIHLKLDVDRSYLKTTQLPCTSPHWFKVHWGHKLFESCGCLLLVFMMDGNRSLKDGIRPQNLNIYEMKNVESGWSMKYLVNVYDTTLLIHKTLNMSAIGFSWDVVGIIVGEREEDSFLVIKVDREVVQYRIVLKTLRKLFDLKPVSHHTDRTNFSCSQFIASFAGV